MNCWLFSLAIIVTLTGIGWHATLRREVGRGGALGPGPCDHRNPPTASFCARCGGKLKGGRHD